jgi:hypothetical protein
VLITPEGEKRALSWRRAGSCPQCGKARLTWYMLLLMHADCVPAHAWPRFSAALGRNPVVISILVFARRAPRAHASLANGRGFKHAPMPGSSVDMTEAAGFSTLCGWWRSVALAGGQRTGRVVHSASASTARALPFDAHGAGGPHNRKGPGEPSPGWPEQAQPPLSLQRTCARGLAQAEDVALPKGLLRNCCPEVAGKYKKNCSRFLSPEFYFRMIRGSYAHHGMRAKGKYSDRWEWIPKGFHCSSSSPTQL